MKNLLLVRFVRPDNAIRLGIHIDTTVYDVTAEIGSIADWLRASCGRIGAAIEALVATAVSATQTYPVTPDFAWLAPIDQQDVWAAGVTYARSREARQEEAIDGGDIYARVYAAERPELFFKARGSWVVAPRGQVGIRRDTSWNVPEPELGLVVNPDMEIVGTVIGNDMSSRDIEGENPLYLPQAKTYAAACALGPGILLNSVGSNWPDISIHMQIERDETAVFQGNTHTNQIRRRPDELVEFMGRCLPFPDGGVLLTGTGIVPPDDFTLAVGDKISISIDGIGTLTNTVKIV